MDDGQRRHLEALLQINQRRLQELEKIAARFGASTPPEVRIEIEDIQTEIARIISLLPAGASQNQGSHGNINQTNQSLRSVNQPPQTQEEPPNPPDVPFEVIISKRSRYQYNVHAKGPASDARGTLNLRSIISLLQRDLRLLEQLDIDMGLVERIGQQLFTKLFHDDIRSLYDQSISELQSGQRLCLVLNMSQEEDSIAALPWELLHDPVRGPLVLNSISVVRGVVANAVLERKISRGPLRVLLTSAQPQGMVTIKANKELDAIHAALVAPDQSDPIQITTDLNLTRQKFIEYMKEPIPFHIWHFCGHVNSGQDGIIKQIYFEDNTGKSDPIGTKDLARWLAGRVLLVVLSAGRTGPPGHAPFRNLAATLIHNHIQAVGMYFAVGADTAQIFSQAFYGALREGASINTCAVEGRIKIADNAGVASPDWGVPDVYCRIINMRLFDPTAPKKLPYRDNQLLSSNYRQLLLKIRRFATDNLSSPHLPNRKYLLNEDIHARTVQAIELAMLRSSLEQYHLYGDLRLGNQGLADLFEALDACVNRNSHATSLPSTIQPDLLRQPFTQRLSKIQRTIPPVIEPGSDQYSSYDELLIELTDEWLRLPLEEGMAKCIDILAIIQTRSRSHLFRALEIMAPALCRFHSDAVDEIAAVAQRIVDLFP